MTTHPLRVVDAPDGVHVHLDDLPEHLRVAIAAAMDPMAKASEPSEFPDPRWPQIAELVEQAQAEWGAWTEALLLELAEIIATGDGTARTAWRLDTAFRRHAAGVLGAFAGVTFDPDMTSSLLRAELAKAKPRGPTLPPDYASTALVPVATALGLGADPTAERAEGERTFPRRPTTPAEWEAVRYAKARAGIYMRKPIDKLHADLAANFAARGISMDRRELEPAEQAAIGEAVARAILERRTVTQLVSDLREAATNTAMVNDMLRVARTELAMAMNHGAWTVMREAAGGKDMTVYRVTGPYACEHCRRIFGVAPNSIRYKMSDLEAHEAAGGNFGKPARDWKATVGPLHPNCACPNWVIDRAEVPGISQSAKDKIAAARAALHASIADEVAREHRRQGGR